MVSGNEGEKKAENLKSIIMCGEYCKTTCPKNKATILEKYKSQIKEDMSYLDSSEQRIYKTVLQEYFSELKAGSIQEIWADKDVLEVATQLDVYLLSNR